MSLLRFSSVLTLAVALLSPLLRAQQPDAAPVDPEATPEARALLSDIDSISGHATLSGQHNYPNTVSRYSDRVLDLTGRYPALFGQDFGFSAGEDKDSVLGRAAMVQEVIRQYRQGSVIALTWHAVRPTEDEPVTFHDSVQGHLTDWEWQQVLTPGTTLHTRWERQVDRIAGYLRELQDAGVPVLFRPYHEMNGNWFWWGGRPGAKGSQELYRQLFDRYVHVHHLHNLVWVWNVNAPSVNAGPVDQYFPGAAFADVVTIDIYGAFERSYYDSMVALAGSHKPVALAEVGTMPTLATLQDQPRWAYFMMWSGSAEDSNTPEQLQAMFHADNVLERGDARLKMPAHAAGAREPAPVDTEAAQSAKALLATLATISFDPAAIDTPTGDQQLAQVTVAETTVKGSLEAIKAAQASGKTVVLRWTPPSPTGAGQHKLDDFEWGELLKSGSSLHAAWMAEVDSFAGSLQMLSHGATAVILDPLPQPNADTFWWGDRPGPNGSQALLRDLHLAVENARVHDLLWAWEPTLAQARLQVRSTPLEEFFPGPLAIDAVLMNGAHPKALHGYPGYLLLNIAGTKPVILNTTTP